MKNISLKIIGIILFASLLSSCSNKGADASKTQASENQNATADSTQVISNTQMGQGTSAGPLTFALVNTDTIFARYDYVVDVQKNVERTGNKLKKDLENQMTAFKAEYDAYLKVGATMTLSEQKKKEAYLQNKQQSLSQLQDKYAQQMNAFQAQSMQDVQDRIFAFIKKYNESHAKYDVILSNARASGVMYTSAKINDITPEVLEALNQEYSKSRDKTNK